MLWILSCAPPPLCVDLRPDPDLWNHVAPYGMLYDPLRDAVWSTSVHDGTLARVDAETGALHGVRLLGETPSQGSEIALADDGALWVHGRSAPVLLRHDPDDGSLLEVKTWQAVYDALPIDDGMALLVLDGAERALVLVDAAGLPHARMPVGAASTFFRAGDDLVVVGSQARRYRLPSLEQVAVEELPIPAERGVALASGDEVYVGQSTVAWRSPAGEVTWWRVGALNLDVLPFDDGVLLIDRHGTDDPNVAAAHEVGPEGWRRSFVLGKNTAKATLDEARGLLWANSEGTSEMLAFDAVTGKRVHAVRTGTWIDGIALTPTEPSVLWLSGRLSDTLVRVDHGRVSASTNAVHWPYSPVYDAGRDRLWLLAQTTGTVWGLDAQTLEEQVRFPLPVGPNPLFTFGSVLWVPSTTRLYAVESNADTLYELDPETGAVLESWPLGGPAVDDPELIGEIALKANADGTALYLARTFDGRIQRFDVATGQLQTRLVDPDLLAPLVADRKVDLLRVFGERGVAWFGGHAFDPDTLAPLPERDLEASAVVAMHPRGDGHWIGISADGTALVRAPEGDLAVGAVSIAQEEQHTTLARLSFNGEQVWVTRARDGRVCPFDRP